MDFKFSQTNIQLYNQLIDAGYPEPDLGKVRDSYEYAMKLFTCIYQPCGKPIISHLVGTASILAWLKVPVEVIAAGLLHAAYRHGELKCKSAHRINPWKRRQVRERVGGDIEDLIYGYGTHPVDSEAFSGLLKKIDLTGRVRNIYLIKLANELEDQLDLGTLYCEEFEYQKFYLGEGRHQMAELAAKLGYPQLSQLIEVSFEAVKGNKRPEEFRRKERFASAIAPASHGLRYRVAARQFLGRIRGK